MRQKSDGQLVCKSDTPFSPWLSGAWATFQLAVMCATGFGRMCLITGHTSCLRRPFLQAWTLQWGVRFITWRLRHPQRGILTGLEAFWGLPDASGLRPCDWTHLKNVIVRYSYAGGAYDKYRQLVCKIKVKFNIER